MEEDDNIKFIIRGQKVEITEAIKNYIVEKIGRLEKYFNSPESLTATVVARIRGNSQIVEVTIPTNNTILRCEVESDDLYASIDLVSDKLERQIRKNKTKMQSKKAKSIYDEFVFEEEVEEETPTQTIVKRKELDTKPMSEEEAMLQLELLGHDFYIFKNDAQNNDVCVLYKRKDGNYGIIDTK